MKYPQLVPPGVCTTPIRLVLDREELTEDGAPAPAFEFEGCCNWQDGGETQLTPEQKLVRIRGRAYFTGDICPELPEITGGYGVIFGEKRVIDAGVKARNPDGTVNFTEVRFK